MNTKYLNNNNVFSIPVGKEFGKENEELQLVYSPFAENIFIATPTFVTELEMAISHPETASDEIKEIVDTVIPKKNVDEYIHKQKPDEPFNTLSILPNNICNFSCSYCYSADGRSNKKLSKEDISSTIQNFIDPDRLEPQKIYISIFGGGEPLISWDLVKHAIIYSHELGEKFGFTVRISLVTNGSIISGEIIDLLKKYDISVTVSFEILEEIQNLQRGHFDKVSSNIRTLIDAGVYVRFRSTLTKDNVKLQRQMIQTAIQNYPEVESIMMEEVTDVDSFKDFDEIKEFYDDLLSNFIGASEIGERYGKSVECSAARNINLLIDRFCPGEFCLTPEGTFSICSRITSPLDNGYENSIYGKVENNHVVIDKSKLSELINVNVYSKDKCENCFAKWHCGGGCYAQQQAYPEEVLEIACNYKREYTKFRLLKDLDNEYRQQYGMPLKEFLSGI